MLLATTDRRSADLVGRGRLAIHHRAAHHERLYASWSSIRSQVYVLLLGRNVAGPDFRDDTYVGHLELAYMIRARDQIRVTAAIERHLESSYARVLASYPDESPFDLAAYAAAGTYVLAYVELAEGPRVRTNIVECEPEAVRVGLEVELVFHETGAGNALFRFRPR